MSFLEQMSASSAERCAAERVGLPLEELQARAADLPPPRRPQLHGFDLIAEIKRTAPSAGVLAAPPGDRSSFALAQAAAYVEAGASLLSVLTEPTRFDGALGDLQAVASGVEAPAMRKDFLVDPWQIWQARALGADAALLIVRMVDADRLRALCDAAIEAGLLVLLEAFDEADLDRCSELAAAWPPSSPLWVGVNTRDLSTLAVDPHRLARLAPHLPKGVPAVAESGIVTADDAAAAKRLGYPLALVGTALMRAASPSLLAAAMLRAGRSA